MIEIEINLYKFGYRNLKKNLYTIKIANDGTGSKTIGNYKYRVTKSKIIKMGKIAGFRRKNRTALYLLYLVLKSMFEKEKIDEKI
jgi:hypothetical protein